MMNVSPVKLLLCALLFGVVDIQAPRANSSTLYDTQTLCDTAAERSNAANPNKWTCERIEDGVSGGNSQYKYKVVLSEDYKKHEGNCEKAIEEYKEFQKEDSKFSKACAASQTKATSSRGAKACLTKARHCNLCVGTAPDEEDDTACQDAPYDDTEFSENEGVNGLTILDAIQGKQSKSYKSYNGEMRAAKKRFANCPLYAAEEFDQIVENREKYEEAKDEAEKSIIETTNDLKKAQAEIQDLQAEQQKVVPDFEEKIKELTEKRKADLQAELEKIGDTIVQVILAIQTAENSFLDQKNKIYSVCYNQARQEIERVKADRRAKISTGQLRSKSGFAGLTAQASTESRLQQYAESVRDNCRKRDNAVLDQIRSAERAHKQALKTFQLQLTKLQKQQALVSTSIMNIQSDPTLRSQMKAERKKADEKLLELGKQIKSRMLEAENLTVLLNKLSEERSKNEQLYALYLSQEADAKKSGVRKGSDKSSVQEFISAAASYGAAIDSAYQICGCTVDHGRQGPYGRCKEIHSELDTNFGDLDTPGSGATKRGLK